MESQMESYNYDTYQSQTVDCIIIKMISQDQEKLSQYKLYLKMKLLGHFKESFSAELFQEFVTHIDSSNVDKFLCWRDVKQKQDVARQLKAIHEMKAIRKEDEDQFELIQILQKNYRLRPLIRDDFVQTLINRNKNTKIQDFDRNQYESSEIKNIQILLNQNDFKNWCTRFKDPINPITSNTPINQATNIPSNQTSTTTLSPAPKIAATTLPPPKSTAKVIPMTLDQSLKETQSFKKILDDNKHYGEDILETNLIRHLINFLQKVGYRVSVPQIEKKLNNQGRLQIPRLKKKFDELRQNEVGEFQQYSQFKQIFKLLMPIQIQKIKLVLDSPLKPQQASLMVIGATGVGKSTFIIKLLDYVFKQINGKIKMPTMNAQHRQLTASSSITSVTKNIQPYQVKLVKRIVTVLDIPGFSDTEGQQKDIQNQVCLEKACKNSKGICFLYLVDDIQFKEKSRLPILAKDIAKRFEYSTKEELEGMLLLIINKKGDQKDINILNIPYHAGQHLKTLATSNSLDKREKIAFQFVAKSLMSKDHFFHPLQEIKRIKQLIQRLNFNIQHQIKRNLDADFVDKIKEQNKILEKNINFYLEKGQWRIAQYHYDQLNTLYASIEHQSTKTTKQIIDTFLKKKAIDFEERLRIFMFGIVNTIKISKSQFQSYISQLNSILMIINLISQKDIQNRIFKQINESFTTITDLMSKSTKEDASIISQICSLFLSAPILKLQQKTIDIEKKCYQPITTLAKGLEYSYSNKRPQQFDKDYQQYEINYYYYQYFCSRFPRIFEKINKITRPIDFKNAYRSKEEEKLKKVNTFFDDLIEEFSKNQQLKKRNISNLVVHYEQCLDFKKSKHLSHESQLTKKLNDSQAKLNQQSLLYCQQLQNVLESQKGFQQKIYFFKTLKLNLGLIKQKISFLSDFADKIKENIEDKVNKKAHAFHKQLQLLTQNINNVDMTFGKAKLLANITKKRQFYEIFQSKQLLTLNIGKSVQKFKRQFTEFSKKLSQSMMSQFFNQNNKTIMKIVKQLASLQRYEGIQEQISVLIVKNKVLFKEKLAKYIQSVTPVVQIQSIRCTDDYRKINKKFIKSLTHYVDNIIVPFIVHLSFDRQMLKIHNQLFQKVKITFQNICEFASYLIFPNSTQFSKYKDNQALNNCLQKDYEYMTVICQIYNLFCQILEKENLLQYIMNAFSLKFNVEEVTISIKESKESIEDYQKSKRNQIENFIASSKKKDIKLLNYQQCKIHQECLDKIKILHDKIKIAKIANNVNNGKSLEQLQENIQQLTCKFQGRQLNRIQKAINIQNSMINFLECRNIFLELKLNKDTDNIRQFLNKLEQFIYSKISKIAFFTLDGVFSQQNLRKLCQGLSQSTQIHKIVTSQDIRQYGITFLKTFDEKISSKIEEVQQEMDNKILELKEKIQQRKFREAYEEISFLERFIGQVKSYKALFPGSSQQEQIVVDKTHEFLANLLNQKKNIARQKSIDELVVKNPLKEDFKQRTPQIYARATFPKKKQIKKHIEEKIEKLLKDFQTVQFTHIKKTAIVINELFQYIPNQIMTEKQYRSIFQQIKNSKIQNQRKLIMDLKNQDKAGFAKIIEKHIQYNISQSNQMEILCFSIIKDKLSQIITIFREQNQFQLKINIAKNNFWNLRYIAHIDDEQKLTVTVKNQFNSMENEIAAFFKNRIYKNSQEFDKIINNDNPHSISTDKMQASINEIYIFFSTFREKNQKVHFEAVYEEITKTIQTYISQWSKIFQIVCPLSSRKEALSSSQKNYSKTKKMLKKLLAKMSVYYLIFDKFYKLEKKDERSMDIQQDNNKFAICTVINTFRQEIDSKIRSIKNELSNIDFNLYVRSSQKQIQQMLIYLDQSAIILQLYQQVLSSSNFGYEFQATNYTSTIKSVKNILNRFINDFLTNLKKSFQIPEQQIPQGLYFLEIFLSKIDSSSSKIFYQQQFNQKEDMVDQTYSRFASNPTKQFNRFIQQGLKKLEEKLKKERLQFCSIKIKIPEHNKKITQFQNEIIKVTNDFRNQLQSQKNTIKERNLNKEPQQISKKIEQAQSLCNHDFITKSQKIKLNKQAYISKYQAWQGQVSKKYCSLLLNLKKLEFNFHSSNAALAKTTQILNAELENIKKARMLRYLSKKLSEFNFQNYAYLLKNDSKVFKFEYYQEFKKKTKAQDINYVKQELRCVQQITSYQFWGLAEKKILKEDKDRLVAEYKQFQQSFSLYICNNKQDKIPNIIKEFKREDNRVKQIAYILAVWSLNEASKNSQQSQDNQLQEEQQSSIIKPHPVQIAALLLLTYPGQISSKIAQILTGEGKSIVLAALAIYYASKGYNVDVSCYSEYLCQRDLQNFQDLFMMFEVKHLVSYLPFHQICKKALDNSSLNLKQSLINIISNRQASFFTNIRNAASSVFNGLVNIASTNKKNLKSILLVDQVDVFFQKDYYGSTFKPILKLNDEKSKKFIEYAFNQFEKNPKLLTKNLSQSKQFKELVQAYPKIQKILRKQLHRMKQEFSNPKNRYFIDENMIKYKDGDKLSEKVHYGYETIFAYCRQYKNKKVTPQNYDQALFIPLIYGQFSYSQLPKRYNAMIGLSGTILDLPMSNIQYLKRQYSINKNNMYLLPSIYGQKSIRTEKLIIENNRQYNNLIVSRIKEEISQGRPVLICFKGYEQLQKFRNSPEFSSSGLMPTYLHEQLDNNLRDKSIKTVGSSKRLTLMTSSFSRGTDFIINDKRVQQYGGLHLILTYAPQKKAEYIQFRGRTARQGQKGSIDVIISQTQANAKNITNKQQSVVQNLYKYIDKMILEQSKIVKKLLEFSLENHKKTQQCFKDIANEKKVIQFLQILNQYSQRKQTPAKIVIGIDGTISMERVIATVTGQVSIIMNRIVELTGSGNFNGSFEVQIVVFRNYNAGQRILEASNYYQNLSELNGFLQAINTFGGMGNQAIQLLYHHINLQRDVDMLILIGDAPPNTEKESVSKRTDKKWTQFLRTERSKNQLYSQTNCTQQQRKFHQKLIINGLYINGNKNVNGSTAQTYFSQVCARHHGTAQELNFNRPDYSERMIEFFTTKILTAANNNQRQEEIKTLYRKTYS